MTDPLTPTFTEWTVGHNTPGLWPPGGTLYRVHQRRYDADAFNPFARPEYRFSPVYRDTDEIDPDDPDKKRRLQAVVPAWYAASTVEGAIAEALLHDIEMKGGTLAAGVFKNRLASSVQVLQPLRLARLDTDGLRALGMKTNDVTDTEADKYPETEAFAQRLYDEVPDAQGFAWMSRRRNTDTCLVLYGDRVPAADLRPISVVRDFDDPADWSWLYDYCKPMRIEVRPPSVTSTSLARATQ